MITSPRSGRQSDPLHSSAARNLHITLNGANKHCFVASIKLLQTHQVQFDFHVTMLARPNIQRRRRNFIDEGNGKPESREVHAFNVMLAGIARFDAQVVVFTGVKIS
jgi:hypothetical protein